MSPVSQPDDVLHVDAGKFLTTVDLAHLNVEEWPEWRKKVVTRAVKVAGPFGVQTSEGPLTCEDGYLAVDARGYPYPIATGEFELIYAPADDVAAVIDQLDALEARLVLFSTGERQPVNLAVTYRAGEWSTALGWSVPAVEALEDLRPASAHANGVSLVQAMHNLMADAERLTEA